MQHHGQSITSMLQQKWRGDILSSLPGLHDTIPLGKDTGRLARSSDLCRGRSTGHNPCQRQKDSSRNSYQARCERGTKTTSTTTEATSKQHRLQQPTHAHSSSRSTTKREAGLGIKRVRKHNFGKGSRQNSDSNSQVHTQPTQGHNIDTTERQLHGRNKQLQVQSCVTSGSGYKDITKPQHGTANAGQHSGYSNSSIHTLYTTEILQPANSC